MKLAMLIPGRRYFAFGPAAPHGTYLGSSYKIGEALRQVCDLDVLTLDRPRLERELPAYDAVLVKGDSSHSFRIAAGLGLPYILICNDVATMRDPAYDSPTAERGMIEGAAAIIFVTGPLRDYCAARYRLPPHEVVNLRPLARDLEFEPLPKLAGRTLVYAGGLVERHLVQTAWGYRCLHEIFAAAIAGGWRVYVYPALPRPRATDELAALGCVIKDSVPEPRLPRELSQYTAGLQAYNTSGIPAAAAEYVRRAVPNKTWLYLSAGIPTVGTNPGFESARIYEGKWGIVLDDLHQFAGLTEADLPRITPALRRSETMEQDVPKLRRLLEGLAP